MAGQLTIDIKIGPVFRASCDVLEFIGELWDLIPDWHELEKLELQARAQTLADTMTAHWKGASE